MNGIKREVEIILSSDFLVPTPPPSPPAIRGEKLPAEIDEDDLQMLSSKLASRVKYPPGCPVWYNLADSSSRRLDARRGAVEGVYMAFETGARVYKVKPQEGKHVFFWQDQLAFGMNCPVWVKDGSSKEMEGTIVCPRTPRGDRKLSYSIMYSVGNRVWVETGVETDEVSYRKAEKKNSVLEEKLGEQHSNSNENSYGNAFVEGSTQMKEKLKKLYTSAKNCPDLDWPKKISSESEDKITEVTNQNNPLNIMPEEMWKSRGASKHNSSHTEATSARKSCSTIEKSDNTSQVKLSHHGGLEHSPTGGASANKNKLANEEASPNSMNIESKGNNNHFVHRSSVDQHLNGCRNSPSTLCPSQHKEHKSANELLHCSAVEQHRNGCGKPPSMLGSLRHQHNNLEGRPQHVHCKLTVPTWVTNSETWNLFSHITGYCDGKKGHKTQVIERETGCAVDISKGVPVQFTIRPMPSSLQGRGTFDMVKAREIVEVSLLEFVDCEGSRVRQYELALSFEGPSHLRRADGIVQQRYTLSGDPVWMKLLDLPRILFQKKNLISFNDDLQHKLRQDMAKCSVGVFGHGLSNPKMGLNNLKLGTCNPFVLIFVSGKSDQVETDRSISMLKDATKLVSGVMCESQRRCSQNKETDAHSNDSTLNNASESRSWRPRLSRALGKRNSDTRSPPSYSHDDGSAERPRKAPKLFDKDNREVMMMLTVPLWVFENYEKDFDLFAHLMGKHSRKHKEIESKTNCLINLPKNSRRFHGKPFILIKSKRNTPSSTALSEVSTAQGLIMDSLLEFIGDTAPERRHDYKRAINGIWHIPAPV